MAFLTSLTRTVAGAVGADRERRRTGASLVQRHAEGGVRQRTLERHRHVELSVTGRLQDREAEGLRPGRWNGGCRRARRGRRASIEARLSRAATVPAIKAKATA